MIWLGKPLTMEPMFFSTVMSWLLNTDLTASFDCESSFLNIASYLLHSFQKVREEIIFLSLSLSLPNQSYFNHSVGSKGVNEITFCVQLNLFLFRNTCIYSI